MTEKLREICDLIRGLNADEKGVVLSEIISGIESDIDDSVECAWQNEAQQRLAELDSKKVQSLSWDEVKNLIASRSSNAH